MQATHAFAEFITGTSIKTEKHFKYIYLCTLLLHNNAYFNIKIKSKTKIKIKITMTIDYIIYLHNIIQTL